MLKHLVFVLLILSFTSSGAEEYWQQEVNYDIDVTLDRDLRTIHGSILIEYINHSPDTLDKLYLKAFPNAMQPGSYADRKNRRMKRYDFAGIKPDEAGSLELIDPFKRDIGSPTRSVPYPKTYRSFETDNTIITVYLDRPLLPGQTVRLYFFFKTVLPDPAGMRMGVEGGVTKAAYWYPQVCVYDWKLGWVNSQYIGWGETYGDYGDFDVRITAPEDQVVAATGVCVNESGVLPDTLKEKLIIDNFLKPKDKWPVINSDPDRFKTWHYQAEKVNDFVFTTSNEFCIDSGKVGDVKVVAYALRHKAIYWIGAVKRGTEAIRTFNELYHQYEWPVIRICDAFSGMEYPMLVNCGGGGPSFGFSLLLYHEIGHNWFMGQVGFNQVDRPFLDEGFTTHAEHNAMEKYYGRMGNMNHHYKWYQKKFAPSVEDRNVRGFRPLLLLMTRGYDKPMVFSYDQGEEYWPYRVSAYYKSAAMHYSLRSILGDSLYYRAMRHFCDKWFFRHPYEEDFTEAMEEATGLEFDNYLMQWYYSRDRLDYGYAGKKTRKINGEYQHTIKLKRDGKLVSPVDVAVIYQQGDTAFFTVPPEGMEYSKPGFILLPTWPQFRIFNDRYEFTVTSRRKISKVVVDPYNLLMDIDRLDNQSILHLPVDFRFDNMKYDVTPVNKYALRWRPDIWYDEPDGVLLGTHWHGSYLDVRNKFSLDFRIGTESGLANMDLKFSTPFKLFGNNSKTSTRMLLADHRFFISEAYEKIFKRYYSLDDREYFRLELNHIETDYDQVNRFDSIPEDVRRYFPEPTWDATRSYYINLKTGWLNTFRYGRYGMNFNTRVGMYKEDDRHRGFEEFQFDFGFTLTRSKKPYLQCKFEYFDMGGTPPSQFIEHLSRASSIDRFTSSQVFRTAGTIPRDWEDDVYLFNGRVRGYQDRSIYLDNSYSGSVEITSPDFLPYRWFRVIPLVGGFLSKLDNDIFIEGASVTMEGKESYYPAPIAFSETVSADEDDRKFYLSAGISITMPPIWSNNRIRLDFPVYLNEPLPGDNEFEFRFSLAWYFQGLIDEI